MTQFSVGRALVVSLVLGVALGVLAVFLPTATGAPVGALIIAWLAFGGAMLAARLSAGRRGGPKAVPAAGEPVRRRDPAVALLAVMQREGRLVDFLREDISGYSDAQVGAAVRAIHENCRRALDEHLALEPVRSEEEGARILVESGFDASAVRLVGNVSGKPPFRGVLRHRGWRSRRVDLPADAAGQDPTIVAPAEIEIG
jgi:hypothetical protein